MSEQNSPSETTKSENTGQHGHASAMPEQTIPSRKSTRENIFSRISLSQFAAGILLAIFLWQWLDSHLVINEMQQQLAKKIAEMDGNNKANQILLSQNQEVLREQFAKVTTLETRYAESQNQRAALEALYNDLSISRDETALAEVEQMLLIAAQQLQLSGNVKAALIAMQSADGRLQRMSRPSFNGLRKAIGQDMDKLRVLPSVDITGINLQINNLISSVDEIPLIYQQHVNKETAAQVVPPKEETTWKKLLKEIWQELKHLVRVENTGKAEIPLLPPTQEYFLRENLKLRLAASKLALISRDENSFKQEIKTAQIWIARYFDEKSEKGLRMSSDLKKLAASNISVEIPDISSSLQAVRNYRLTREKAVR